MQSVMWKPDRERVKNSQMTKFIQHVNEQFNLSFENYFELYKTIRPGLSGLWQVSGRNNTTYEERVNFDKYYIENKTFLLDIKIFFKTFISILFRTGAY